MGIDDDAEILEILACPPIQSGSGRIVTGKFVHTASHNEIIDIHVESEPYPLGVTRGHSIWSATRKEFVHAGKLQVGEELLTRDGRTVPILAISRRGKGETVYNIEVQVDHAYQVAHAGLVVHNASSGEGSERLTNSDIDDLAQQLKDGKIKLKDLKKRGLSAEDIADIQAKSKQIRPRSRGSDRIIDQIGKSEDRVKNALEQVKQNPNDPDALNELQAAQQQLAEIQAAQQDIIRRGGE